MVTTMGRTEDEALRWLDRVAPARRRRIAERPDLADTFAHAYRLEAEEARLAGWGRLRGRLDALGQDMGCHAVLYLSRHHRAERWITEAVSVLQPCGPIEALEAAEGAFGIDRRDGRDALQRLIESGDLVVGWDRKLRVKESE